MLCQSMWSRSLQDCFVRTICSTWFDMTPEVHVDLSVPRSTLQAALRHLELAFPLQMRNRSSDLPLPQMSSANLTGQANLLQETFALTPAWFHTATPGWKPNHKSIPTEAYQNILKHIRIKYYVGNAKLRWNHSNVVSQKCSSHQPNQAKIAFWALRTFSHRSAETRLTCCTHVCTSVYIYDLGVLNMYYHMFDICCLYDLFMYIENLISYFWKIRS